MKLSSLTLCFSALILFASCAKEDFPPPSGNLGNNSSPSTVIASEWTTESSLTWSNDLTTSGLFTTTTLDAPALTNEMVNEGTLLIYAKTSGGDNPQLLPATFERTGSSEVDVYSTEAEAQIIRLRHVQYDNNAYVAPSVRDDISFRYILLSNALSDDVPNNGRIITSNGLEYNLDDLRAMSYGEVTAALGITD